MKARKPTIGEDVWVVRYGFLGPSVGRGKVTQTHGRYHVDGRVTSRDDIFFSEYPAILLARQHATTSLLHSAETLGSLRHRLDEIGRDLTDSDIENMKADGEFRLLC